MVHVLVVDDHRVFAESLARGLQGEPDLEVTGVAYSVEEALRGVDEQVDVVLCDYALGDGDGIAFTRAALARHPGLRVVMLTASADEAVLASALEVGCSGFVTKAEDLSTVIAAVRGAVAGEAIITPALLARLLPRLSTRSRGPNPGLSDREREVLQLVVAGHSNQEIADELVIALDTARNHVRSILAKLDVHSKLQAAAVAVKRGIVTLPRVRS